MGFLSPLRKLLLSRPPLEAAEVQGLLLAAMGMKTLREERRGNNNDVSTAFLLWHV